MGSQQLPPDTIIKDLDSFIKHLLSFQPPAVRYEPEPDDTIFFVDNVKKDEDDRSLSVCIGYDDYAAAHAVHEFLQEEDRARAAREHRNRSYLGSSTDGTGEGTNGSEWMASGS
ncbi:hypothetical protein N7490_010299 [Penicillium lividum]|nr:hypothetical protein N7490_010299 [Penicillium lividum]